jgi:RsiW-degrading membrane proteinase PrsW (M82 family)
VEFDTAAPTEPPPERTAGPGTHLLVILTALVGGALGIAGAFVEEIRAGGFLLLPFVGAPIIEEALKPTGVYIALWRWPQALRSQLYRALLAAAAGVVFGVIESTVYVTVYASDYPDWYIPFRFSVPVALHATCSYIAGLGIDQRLFDWAQGRAPLPKTSRNYFLAAMIIHGSYNLIVTVLALTGVLDF